MTIRLRSFLLAPLCGALVAAAPAAPLPTPSPVPLPLPTPTPVPTPADPCGSLLSIVNRPTFGTGVCTVRTGHVDIENGYENLTTTGGSNTVSYPQSLIRIGTFDPHLDLEVGPLTTNRTSSAGVPIVGGSDFAFGAKYELGYTSRALWGVNALVTVPTGGSTFGAGNAQFTGNFNWGYTLNSEFGLSGTLGFNAFSAYVRPNVAQSYFAFTPTLELTAALPGGPSQIGLEYAYFSSAGPGLGSKFFADAVYQRDFGQHVQVDVEYGFSPGPSIGPRQHYIGAGITFMN